MADDRLHIIITSENDRGRSFVLGKKLARNFAVGLPLCALLLSASGVLGARYFKENKVLHRQLITAIHQLNQQTADLAATRNSLAAVQEEKARLVASYEDQVADLRQEQSRLEGSITRLDERSRIIQTVMDHIGVEVKVEEDPEHSGGLFIEPGKDYGDKLISSTEKYLKVLQKLPLGRPIQTKISSGYGLRIDPFNKKKAFHSGIDFKGKTGDPVHATGDAVVKRTGYNKGLGRYVLLAHGNGYESVFAHLQKRLVKKGDKVRRGQVIGLLGNTGRSTGSHLHYELRYRGRAINPMKYLQVAGLRLTIKQ